MVSIGDLVFSRDRGVVSKLIQMRTLSQWSHVGLCVGVVNEGLLERLKLVNKKYVKVCSGDIGKHAVISARWDGVNKEA